LGALFGHPVHKHPARRQRVSGVVLTGHLAGRCRDRDDAHVEPEPVVYREEVTAILIALGDMNVNIREIRELLEEELGGEGEAPEDDA
jgi:hypothetical protein